MVITGDGTREFRVLNGLAQRFNGEKKILCFPLKPIKIKFTGISALNSLRVYPGNYGIKSFLFLVDKEHIKKDNKSEITKYLEKEIKMRITAIEEFKEALQFDGTIGKHKVTVFCVVFGKEKFVEEEIAELIELEFGDKIKALQKKAKNWPEKTKSEIRTYLRNKKLDEEKLILNAKKKNLYIAFNNLCPILEIMEK